MKKSIAILLSSFYLILTMGISGVIHYCGGELESIELFAKSVDCCCGEEEDMSDCCDDNQFCFQLDTDQQLSDSYEYQSKEVKERHSKVPVKLVLTSFSLAKEFRYLDLPPPDKVPAYINNCTLVFYA